MTDFTFKFSVWVHEPCSVQVKASFLLILYITKTVGKFG